MERGIPKHLPNSLSATDAEIDDGTAIAALLSELRERGGPIKTEALSRLINSRPDLVRPIPKTTFDKWFANPTGSAFRPPPRDRPDIADALIVAFDELNAWKGEHAPAKQREVGHIRSYFAPPAVSSDIESRTGAIAREIERRRDPVVTARALFDHALRLNPTILCVIPEATLAAEEDADLLSEIIRFVKEGGCYAVIVPGGKPSWPSENDESQDDGLHDLVSNWRKIHSGAWTLVRKIRRAMDDSGVHDPGNATNRVQLIQPNLNEDQRNEHFRLIRLLPPTIGPAIRPWLLFAGTDPLEDAMAYTCGSIESSDGQVWTQLSMVAPAIASSLGVMRIDASHFTRPRHDQEALKRYCWDVLQAWQQNDRQHLGTSCGNTWKYYAPSIQDNE